MDTLLPTDNEFGTQKIEIRERCDWNQSSDPIEDIRRSCDGRTWGDPADYLVSTALANAILKKAPDAELRPAGSCGMYLLSRSEYWRLLEIL